MRFELNSGVEILQATPAAVRAMVGGLSEDWTASSSGEGDWSVHDVVGHLIHADETDWVPRADVILGQDRGGDFPPFDRFGHFEKSRGKTLAVLLDELEVVRAENISKLKGWNLNDADLELKGVHPEFGEVTLRQLLATWVVHDLTHIRQIAIILAKKYEKEVGPWREYLSILK